MASPGVGKYSKTIFSKDERKSYANGKIAGFKNAVRMLHKGQLKSKD